MIKKILFFMFMSILFVSSCSFQPSCADENPEYFETVEKILMDWDTLNNEMRSEMYYTSGLRSLPSGSDAKVKEIRDGFRVIQVPECANDAHALLDLSMDGEVLVYFNFLRGQDKNEIDQLLNDVHAVRETFNESWESLK